MQSTLFSQHFTRTLTIFIVGWLCCYNMLLHAEPWKCGTPLLCEHTPTIQENGSNRSNVLAAPAAPAKLGQIDRFFIHLPETSINAICVAVGIHCYVYVDETFQDMLTIAEAESVSKTFDNDIYSKVHHWIGTEFQPGLDRDNKITILFHDVGMNASGKDYGGYFSPTDQKPTYPTSNRRDMLYMDIFQFKERTRHTFYSSLAHEFAHLVNWYQNGGTTDQRWLEEGIASFTEFGIYGTVHTLFVDGYLAEPSMSLTTANTFESYYGAAFMFLLYLYEKHGGINYIRQLAAEDTLGIPAIDATLGENKDFVDVFLKWGIANWLNNPVNGRDLSYHNLPKRKVTKPTPRITRYPTTSIDIPIDSWGMEYILLQNLPENIEITLTPNNQSKLHANIAYFAPNRNHPIIIPVPTLADPNLENNQNINEIELTNLMHEGEILLVVTSEYPQTFRYVAVEGQGNTPIDINNIEIIPIRDLQHTNNQLNPRTVTYSPHSSSQEINLIRNVGISLISSNLAPKLEPMTQIHLSSKYNQIEVHEENAFAASDWGLEIFNLTPTPIHIGEIETPGTANAIAVDGNYVYISDGVAGVHQIDINQLTSPSITKTLTGFHDARDIHIADGNLYALDTVRGLLIYNIQDILNKETPHPRRTYKTAGIPLNVSTDIDGNIYVSDSAQGLYKLTLDPFAGFIINGIAALFAYDFEIIGNNALVASADMRILDIRNPFAPAHISQENTPGLVSSLRFYNGLLYLTDRQSGLHIVNVNNLKIPRVVSTIPTYGNAENVALWYSDDRETFAYVADGKAGIQTINVSNPNTPIWINHYNAGGNTSSLDVVNDSDEITVAIANGTGGLKVAEFNDPYNGEITQHIQTSGQQGVLSVKIRRQHGFIGTDNGLDVVHLETGEILSQISTKDPVFAIALINDYAYLCAKSLFVVDIKVPERSRIVAQRILPGTAYRITYEESHVFIASLEGGVQVFDIADPAEPRLISQYETVGAATNVTIDGDNLYVLDNRNGILKLDAQNPNQLVLTGEYPDTQLPIAAAVKGEYLYLLDIESLQIIDTGSLHRQARFSQFQSPTDLVLTDSTVYVTDQYQLKIFRVHTDQSRLAVEEYPKDGIYHSKPLISAPKNQLLQNHPNPFNPETWIPYSLANNSNVSLTIYDTHGNLVIQQTLGFQKSGNHSAYWDGRNIHGEPVASGVYYYTIKSEEFSQTRKMVVRR